MTVPSFSKDLVVLTADKNAQFVVRGILSRFRALGLRDDIAADFLVHPHKDPGMLLQPELLLRSHCRTHAYAMLLMDREGCGREELTRVALEHTVEAKLYQSGWRGRAAAVVVDPELDVWIWSDSPHVVTQLHWQDREPGLRQWLADHGYAFARSGKPERPKEALEAALREVRLPRSSAIYLAIAEKVSLDRCSDHAFVKMRQTLRAWFAGGS